MKLDNVADIYPLSPLQQGILFEALVGERRDALYVEQFGYRLRGPLSVAAFRAAWQALLDRHAALRTAFFWDGLDKPVQVVRKALPLPWTELDWRDRDAAAQAAATGALQDADRATGFTPSRRR
ncbi:condensation domain-containing protein [Pseudoroseomonas wenyumeiae]